MCVCVCVCLCVCVCVHVHMCMGMWGGVCLIVPTLCNALDCNHQAPLSVGFFRQEYWSGLTFLSPGDLPDPGIEPTSPVSAALQADS